MVHYSWHSWWKGDELAMILDNLEREESNNTFKICIMDTCSVTYWNGNMLAWMHCYIQMWHVWFYQKYNNSNLTRDLWNAKSAKISHMQYLFEWLDFPFEWFKFKFDWFEFAFELYGLNFMVPSGSHKGLISYPDPAKIRRGVWARD